MNTRLQVEHPVTELVTGIDLVEEMIRIAAGETLRLRQADVRQSGWAVETRVYAEEPATGFLPSTGRLVGYRPPPAGARDGVTVRIDSGVEEGSEVSRFYDPMIAKLITHAPTRAAAIAAQGRALDGFAIDGVRTNTAFLAGLMRNARWGAGELSTAFLDEEYSSGFADTAPDEATTKILACVAAAIDDLLETRRRGLSSLPLQGGDRTPPDLIRGSREGVLSPAGNFRAASREGSLSDGPDPHPDGFAVSTSPVQGVGRGASARIVRLGRRELPAGVERTATGWHVHLDGTPHAVASDWRPGDPIWSGTVDGEDIAVQVRSIDNGWSLTHAGASADTFVFDARPAAFARRMRSTAASDSDRAIKAPMPALVVSVAVAAGQPVKQGDPVAVLEAMKMEHVLKAPRDGTVAAVHAKPGQTLAMAALVAEIE
jgi:propionyl-CoA carboxylase alpha chain